MTTTTTLRPATTVPARDRGIDIVRAIAVVGVVGGHWLVTGLVIGDGGAWRQASPLSSMPALAPVSWLFQTLALLFFAGGFGAGRPRTATTRSTRSKGVVRRLAVPLVVLLGVWAVVLVVATAAGVPYGTLRTIAMLVVSPLWFLLPYLVLRAATGPLSRAVDRAGPVPLVLPAIGLVALSDAGLLPMWAAVPAAWAVPWVLGIAVARRGRASLNGPLLIVSGIVAMAVLVLVLHYPASAVGVPGDGRSNLSPPSLFAIALGLVQIGIYLLAAGRLGRSSPNGCIGYLNRAALPIYLGHQSVLVATVGLTALIAGGPVNGLLTAPAGPPWIFARLAWLPFLALVLVALIRVAWPATRRSRAAWFAIWR